MYRSNPKSFIMRKLLVIAALILFAGVAFGQTIQKSNLIGLHIVTITPDPDVTMNQYLDFFITKYIPEYEKVTGVKLLVLRSVRGENENKFGLIYYFESEEYRDMHFNEDDTLNELGISKFEKLQPVSDELRKLGSRVSEEYDDWLVL